MSDSDTSTTPGGPTPDEPRDALARPAGDAPTETLAPPELPSESPPPEGESYDDIWPVRGPARGIRLAAPAALLVAVLLVAGGFWGGAIVEKNHRGASTGGNGLAGSFAARFRNAAGGTGTAGTGTTGTGSTGTAGATAGTGTATSGTAGSGTAGAGAAGGFGGFGGAAAGTVGTISVVSGNTLYVLTAAGALVKVTLAASTTITRDANANAVGLRPGDSVVVQGATSKSGTVSATSVAATAAGVSATARFGGGGFSRTGAVAGSTTSGSAG